MSDEPSSLPSDEAEADWTPVSRWDSETIATVQAIRDCSELLPLLEGAADDFAVHTAKNFLAAVRSHAQSELAARLLAMHGIELPPADDWKTPQQQISQQLKSVADAVRDRRADIRPEDVGMSQPPHSRARRHLPDMAPPE